jgi:predicted MFS family arabinose efflux permease
MGLTCIGVATAPNFASLLIIFWAMGLTALIPSLLPATVSALTPKQYRGQVLGILLSGTFSGIIIARSICGIVAQSWGWKSVYILAAIGMLGTALIFKVVVPEENMRHKTSYWALQQSLLLLWKQHSDLRLSCKINTLLFSCYLGIWSLLPLLLSGSPWKFGPGLIGTFGFLGLGSILAAPLIGRLIDRFGCEAIVKSGISTCLLGITIMVILKNHLPALVAGIIALDLGFKSSNIANQTRIQLLDTSAGSRMNGQYFMLSYVGAAIFSGLIVLIWKQWEWTGSCCIMLLMILIALLIEKTDGNRIRSV